MSIFKPLCLALLSAAALFAASCGGDEPKTIQYNLSAVQPGEDFTDPRDNNVYHTVRVGDQLWMAENLRYAPNGTVSTVPILGMSARSISPRLCPTMQP